MKRWLHSLLSPVTHPLLALGLLGVALAPAVRAQQQPVVSVSMTSIDVVTNGGLSITPITSPHEASADFDPTGWLNLHCRPLGTFPANGYEVEFFVNNTSIGIVDPKPAGGTEGVLSWTPPSPGAYNIHVRVSDGANTALSLPIRFFVRGTLIQSPVNNTLVPSGSSIVLTADATTGLRFIKSIQFYDADTNAPVGEADTTYPYSVIYTPSDAADTVRRIVAVATDNYNATLPVSAPVTLRVVPPIGPTPTCRISSPIHEGAIAIPTDPDTDISVAVDAYSPSGRITRVELYVDGVLFGTRNAYPYAFDWHPTTVGTYKLVALAYDDKYNVISSSTNTAPSATPGPTIVTISAPPTVTITAPGAGTTQIGGTVTALRATATSSDGNAIMSVQFFVDDAFVGEATTPASGSTYTVPATMQQKLDENGDAVPSVIKALAINAVGLAAMSPGLIVNVTAGGSSGGGSTEPIGLPPVGQLTSPSAGTVIAVGTALSFTATASDPDGSIHGVQFFVDGENIATDTTYPFATTWTPINPGVYEVALKILDSAGNTVSTTPIRIGVTVAGDLAYAGSYVGAAAQGAFGAISLADGSGRFIGFGHQAADPVFVSSTLTLGSGGQFSFTDAGLTTSGQFGLTGVSGSISPLSAVFIGSRALSLAGETLPAGYYTGYLSGRATANLSAILGADGLITFSVVDGTTRDAGAGQLGGNRTFTIVTPRGTSISGSLDASGFLRGAITGPLFTGTYALGRATGPGLSDGVLLNISTRGEVRTGDQIMITGFIIDGTTPKRILLRAGGPAIAGVVPGALTNPRITLYQGSTAIASNDDWENTSDLAALQSATTAVGATPYAAGSRDAALLATLPPGVYSAHVASADSSTGVAIVEGYDTDSGLPSFTSRRLLNISTRGYVGTGNGIMIVGFIVNGNSPKRVLLRAAGPALAGVVPGALADPHLTLYHGSTAVFTNDNWDQGNDAALVSAVGLTVGASPYPAGSKDAALVLTLAPGAYSLHVSGVGSSTGVAIAEVFEVE